MTVYIGRDFMYRESVSLNTAANTTAEIDVRGYSAGCVYVPNGSSITSITWHGSPAPKAVLGNSNHDDAAEPLYDEFDVAVSQTVAADRACEIPAACFSAGAIYPVVNAAGTVKLSLKG